MFGRKSTSKQNSKNQKAQFSNSQSSNGEKMKSDFQDRRAKFLKEVDARDHVKKQQAAKKQFSSNNAGKKSGGENVQRALALGSGGRGNERG